MECYTACVECGNDDPSEGHDYCLDCLEALFPDSDPPASARHKPTVTGTVPTS